MQPTSSSNPAPEENCSPSHEDGAHQPAEPSPSQQESPLRDLQFSAAREETALSREQRRELATSLSEVVRDLRRMEGALHDVDVIKKNTHELESSLKSTFKRRLWIGFGAGTVASLALMGVSEAAGPLVFAGLTAHALVDYIWKSETQLRTAFAERGKALRGLLKSIFDTARAATEFHERASNILGGSQSSNTSLEGTEYGVSAQSFQLLERFHPEMLSEIDLTIDEIQRLDMNSQESGESASLSEAKNEMRVALGFLKSVQHFLDMDNGRNRSELKKSLQHLQDVLRGGSSTEGAPHH